MPIRIEFGILESEFAEASARPSEATSARLAKTPPSPKSTEAQKAIGFVKPKFTDFVKKPSHERTWLAFELLPGLFPEQWAAAFAQEVNRKSLWHFNFGALFVIEPYYRNKITARLKALRHSLAATQTMTVADSDITPYCKRKVLETILHECTEIKLASGGKGTAAKIADDVSDLVRHYLQIYHPEFHFHISLQAYLPQTYHLPKETHSLFTCDRKDGWLYLDYIGKGQDSLACYNEKSVVDHEPQTLFSANSQILYRDNFDGEKLKTEVANWLRSNNQSAESIGLIPIAKPLHSFSRIQVRELFAKSDTTLKIRIFQNDQIINSEDLSFAHSRSNPYFEGGYRQKSAKWLLRKTSLDLPVNFLIDCHHRYGGSLWMIKQPYYWLKPRAFRAYFTLSWPVRIVIYYFQYQISVGFIDYRTLAKVYTGRLIYAATWPFHFLRPYVSQLFLLISFPIRYLFYVDWPTVTKVAWGRVVYAATLPFHLIRPHAFKFYFAVSRPLRKAFYFAKFQFEKRILKAKK